MVWPSKKHEKQYMHMKIIHECWYGFTIKRVVYHNNHIQYNFNCYIMRGDRLTFISVVIHPSDIPLCVIYLRCRGNDKLLKYFNPATTSRHYERHQDSQDARRLRLDRTIKLPKNTKSIYTHRKTGESAMIPIRCSILLSRAPIACMSSFIPSSACYTLYNI